MTKDRVAELEARVAKLETDMARLEDQVRRLPHMIGDTLARRFEELTIEIHRMLHFHDIEPDEERRH
jgi:predicted nuclease with TOPRIM domain